MVTGNATSDDSLPSDCATATAASEAIPFGQPAETEINSDREPAQPFGTTAKHPVRSVIMDATPCTGVDPENPVMPVMSTTAPSTATVSPSTLVVIRPTTGPSALVNTRVLVSV